jgi:hypothetical protein
MNLTEKLTNVARAFDMTYEELMFKNQHLKAIKIRYCLIRYLHNDITAKELAVLFNYKDVRSIQRISESFLHNKDYYCENYFDIIFNIFENKLSAKLRFKEKYGEFENEELMYEFILERMK